MFSYKQVTFVRLKLSLEGYLLGSTITKAIMKFPIPSMLTGPQYFLDTPISYLKAQTR